MFDQYDPVDPASVISAADEADVAEADSTFVEKDEERGGELGASAEKETYSSSETGQTDSSEISESVIQGQNREQNEGELDP